jgi:hypothetical protein
MVKGGFTYAPGGFSVTGTYTYSVSLAPEALVGNTTQILQVSNPSLSLQTNYSGPFGFLQNILSGLFFNAFEGSFTPTVTAIIQQAFDSVIQQAFGGSGAPAGTTACVTSVSISPSAGITVHFTAAVPVTSACPSNSGGGG